MNTGGGARQSWMRTARAVAWSFLGVRRASGRDDDARLNPLQIVAGGIVAVFLFVLALMALVHWIA